MASETTFGHWKVVFSWGKGRKMTFSQNPLIARFWASGFWMSILSSANFKKDPPWKIFFLSVHAPATSAGQLKGHNKITGPYWFGFFTSRQHALLSKDRKGGKGEQQGKSQHLPRRGNVRGGHSCGDVLVRFVHYKATDKASGICRKMWKSQIVAMFRTIQELNNTVWVDRCLDWGLKCFTCWPSD